MDPVNAVAKFEVRISPVPENSDCRLEFWMGVVNHNLGEEEVVGGSGWYHLKES